MPTPWSQFFRPLPVDATPPRAKISDAFPDVPVVNQFGVRRQFRRDFVNDGGALIINSMYTQCRGTCPGTSATLQQLRSRLSGVFGKRLTMLSFTLEPQVDTPPVLLDYARLYGADKQPRGLCDWHFLHANPLDVTRLRRSLGLFDLDPRVDSDVTQHASLLLVGNCATDRWCALPAELRVSVLIESIRRVAGFTFEQRYGLAENASR